MTKVGEITSQSGSGGDGRAAGAIPMSPAVLFCNGEIASRGDKGGGGKGYEDQT